MGVARQGGFFDILRLGLGNVGSGLLHRIKRLRLRQLALANMFLQICFDLRCIELTATQSAEAADQAA
jgi:hypothetical protein